ncbi:uncharacterized protein LOC113358386 isoform X2 [Papaver somniferum]|uniref:uncharacterized protein LOC113358386 isoform X2 n=1 Tax=Papaver somniferum TaxID=3469 RepID=UPI000E6FD123|nr:uncharacterized protein LOC113358386 isoform X2 [Papaver somniferum]
MRNVRSSTTNVRIATVKLIQVPALVFFIFLLIQSQNATSSRINRTILQRRQVFSVTDYGATGDGIHYDTPHIQAAIDACHATGGGRVKFPIGNYLTATIYLKSGVMLDLQKNATILGGTKLSDYPLESHRWYVVLAESATDVGIMGQGIIDGQGPKFVEKINERKNIMVSWNATGACFGDECRPRLVGFLDCTNVGVSDVLFTQPAYWCLHIVRCDNTSIDGLSIFGDFNTPNNDGIDVEDSNNTVITRCIINTGDDAICPKTSTGPVHNLTVSNSWIRTKSSAIKLGSASWYDFKGLLFDNITIVDSHRGLALQLRDGGNASDITFSNIKVNTRYYDPSWWGRAEPIYITTCPRYSYSKVGIISNVQFINISVNSENGVFLSGSSEGVLSNLNFINVNLTYSRWSNFADGLVDYRPGCQGLVNHSSAGIIMDHVDGLRIENMNMKWSNTCLKGWNNPLDFSPSTVNNISILGFNSALMSLSQKSI